jgi:predicted transcriptional regulator
MKQCPECHNKGWKPTQEFSQPLKNFGKKSYKSFSVRYIMCLNCGYRFKTIERFYDEVQPPPDLFEDS